MVKAELTIKVDEDDRVHIRLDLLKREDWKQDELQIADTIQKSLLKMIDLLKRGGQAKELKREIIEDKRKAE